MLYASTHTVHHHRNLFCSHPGGGGNDKSRGVGVTSVGRGVTSRSISDTECLVVLQSILDRLNVVRTECLVKVYIKGGNIKSPDFPAHVCCTPRAICSSASHLTPSSVIPDPRCFSSFTFRRLLGSLVVFLQFFPRPYVQKFICFTKSSTELFFSCDEQRSLSN